MVLHSDMTRPQEARGLTVNSFKSRGREFMVERLSVVGPDTKNAGGEG